jgi:hypothetical protein
MRTRLSLSARLIIKGLLLAAGLSTATSQIITPVPVPQRGSSLYERKGMHDANNIRTEFWNYGMVGNYPSDPANVDLSTFHSFEVPKGSGVNYGDGTTPFILAKIKDSANVDRFLMETGYRERQASRLHPSVRGTVQRFEPRPGYFQESTVINRALSPAISNDTLTWPASWPDKDATWDGTWNGYFGKRPAADQESFTVMDDDLYDAYPYYPDSRDSSRDGLAMRIEVRGFQWSNPQAGNVIFWHYDITNEATVDYPKPGDPENIIFGIYMDSGVGGEALSCDGVYESDDDNATWDKTYTRLNLVYTWDLFGHGVGVATNCAPTGYLGYAYLETPGEEFDGRDNDGDGIIDESRGPDRGQHIVGQGNIAAYFNGHPERYNVPAFEAYYGKLEERPAFKVGDWWTGDENMNWTALYDDVGSDGIGPKSEKYTGPDADGTEGNGMPDQGEPNFGKTDPQESDQIGLTGFKMNRIGPGRGNPSTVVDDIVFAMGIGTIKDWPQRLYQQFANINPDVRFDATTVLNYNIGFLFASGPFTLKQNLRERFSLALAFGADLGELRRTVTVVQAIYNANYEFSTPPPTPTIKAEVGDHYVQLSWDDVAENATNPLVGYNAFEGYRVYRSTDPEFTDPKVIVSARGTTIGGNGKPIAQFDLKDGITGYSSTNVEGISYYLGSDNGLTHSYRDETVTNGQLYYYAVCAYDFGPTLTRYGTVFTYYPSESPITVSRTLRGGTVLPKNVVAVRPNPKIIGFASATASNTTRFSGSGTGTVNIKVVVSPLVPDNHAFKVTFNSDPDSVHATTYNLIDTTAGDTLFRTGNIYDGSTNGQAAKGLLPVIFTPDAFAVDSAGTGFTPASTTNASLDIQYNNGTFPKNYKRFGFPWDLTIRFSNTAIDTTVAAFPYDPLPVKFTVIAHTPEGDVKLPFLFTDLNGDSTLSHVSGGNSEAITILTGPSTLNSLNRSTWIVKLKSDNSSTVTPTQGDVFEFKLFRPFTTGDEFVFSTTAEAVADAGLKTGGDPYVVPNPYVGAASFEPANFGVVGRGDRRLEFRNITRGCTIRIFTVKGELVRTLTQDGSTDGYVTWDLRTKDNLDAAPGLYIYHVDEGSAGTFIGKFAVIK